MSRNPYHRDGESPSLRRSVLVFMDILGYSKFVEEAHESKTMAEALEGIYRALSGGRSWMRDYNHRRGSTAPAEADLYTIKAFTDNIVIGWPIRGDAEDELTGALSMLAGFQMQLIMAGFFVRGAASVGMCYVDDIVVFGEALLEAYNAEAKDARDPRVILTTSVVGQFRRHFDSYVYPRYNKFLLCDADGHWFVSYLEVLMAKKSPYEELLAHKSAIEQKLGRYQKDPPIWSKYAWVAAYHNYFCKQHRSYFSDEYRIDVEGLRGSPRTILEAGQQFLPWS
jgi:hypothetical protein